MFPLSWNHLTMRFFELNSRGCPPSWFFSLAHHETNSLVWQTRQGVLLFTRETHNAEALRSSIIILVKTIMKSNSVISDEHIQCGARTMAQYHAMLCARRGSNSFVVRQGCLGEMKFLRLPHSLAVTADEDESGKCWGAVSPYANTTGFVLFCKRLTEWREKRWIFQGSVEYPISGLKWIIFCSLSQNFDKANEK